MARIIKLDKLRFRDMLQDLEEYAGLAPGLIELPVPDRVKIGRKRYSIPASMDVFTEHITYGQRLYLAREEPSDVGLILRIMNGYYYPIVTKEEWNEEKSVKLGNKILSCRVKELYPVAMHIVKLISKIAEREKQLLHRDPSKLELAAGVEKLDVFSEMMSLDFLRDTMKISIPEVLLTPYNECLVRFMIHKEVNAFNERYMELMKEQKPAAKSKYNAEK